MRDDLIEQSSKQPVSEEELHKAMIDIAAMLEVLPGMSTEKIDWPVDSFDWPELRAIGEHSAECRLAYEYNADDPPTLSLTPLRTLFWWLAEQQPKTAQSDDKDQTTTVTTTKTGKPKKKRGRKSNLAAHKKIADEYSQGLNNREWDTQAEYLRKRHPDKVKRNPRNAASWLSQVLKKVKESENS